MRTMGSWALRIVCVLFLLLLHPAEGSNSTATDTTPNYTGWRKGPAERGSMTIIWGCLTTVFACTWTILHLNVPGRDDGTWRKLLRKTKWMAITVIFPEFIFAKAVCELQMAVEDLHELQKQEEPFGWKVEYGRGCRLLYWLFNSRISSLSQPLPAVAASGIKEVNTEFESSKKWTLTHSYLANMGGIVQNQPLPFPAYKLVTAHGLARCCVPNKHSLPKDIRLTQEEILDKSKADNLLKTVAALQILWLIVSVIARKWYRLPISLLEVCTVAFATLAVATYGANLAKPKDVDVPITIVSKNCHGDDFQFRGESFFARTVRPSKADSLFRPTPRIKNDMLRLQSHGTQYVTLTYALAVSTMCFGAIHCGAWQSYFPSQVERRLWQVASVLSSTLPLINLLVVSTSNLMLGRQAHKIITTTESLMRRSSEPTSEPVQRKNQRRRIKLWSKGGILGVERHYEPNYEVGLLAVALAECIISLIEVNKCVEKGEASRSWCRKYLKSFGNLSGGWPDFAYDLQLDDPTIDVAHIWWSWSQRSVNVSDLSEDAISLALGLINHSRGTMGKFHGQWDLLTRRVNRISTLFAWLTGFLYATARLTLIAVAFAAFRKQNEDLYIDTWARFMPSWR